MSNFYVKEINDKYGHSLILCQSEDGWAVLSAGNPKDPRHREVIMLAAKLLNEHENALPQSRGTTTSQLVAMHLEAEEPICLPNPKASAAGVSPSDA